MKENELLYKKFYIRSRGYSSFKGEIGRIAYNLHKRNFDVDKVK